ncbi:MAG: C39 family peptidase [bacterium]|nr:C39 family peptidase [bacterium]
MTNRKFTVILGIFSFGLIIASFVAGKSIGGDLGTTIFKEKYSFQKFEDVENGQWYSSAIANLSMRGILNTTAKKFYPNNFMRRGEAAVLMNNMLNYMEEELEGSKRKAPKNEKESDEIFDPLSDLKNSQFPDAHSLSVPFSSQAPFGNWNMPYQEACEEAAMIMVEYFLGELELNKVTADVEILDIVDWENENGYAVDVSAQQVVDIMNSYFSRKSRLYVGKDVTVDNIKKLIAAGYPVILPTAGQSLGNTNFTGNGPLYHMVVVVGYQKGKFVTHDPGTSRGREYLYSEKVLLDAIHDWSGVKGDVYNGQKAMVIVSP